MPSAYRALLVEFVNADQQPGRVAVLFPVLSGWLAREAVPARWLRFAVSTTNLLRHDRDAVTLADDELATLLAASAAHAPTLVVLTDALAPEQDEALARAVPGALRHVSQETLPPLAGHPAFRAMAELEDPAFLPLYDWEAGNAAAKRKDIDSIFLLAPETCGYAARVAANPLYRELDDPRVDGRRGCAFCLNRVDDVGAAPGWTDALVRQIRAAAGRRSPDGAPGAFLLPRVEQARVLAACVDALNETGLSATTALLVALRADRVDALAGFARDWFREHPGSPLRLGVYACGIESFDDDELARFNKGLTAADGLHALTTLRALAAELPGRFSYYGLTFILFTPWTTLAGLRRNLQRFVDLAFVEARNVFESRLRLHPQLAITALAERDGLLVDDEPDPLLVMNRRKLFGGERAWRFVDPRVRPVCRIALRFDLADGTAVDPLTLQVRRFVGNPARVGGQVDRLQLLLDVVDEAAAREPPCEAEPLFEAACRRYLARRGAAADAPGRAAPTASTAAVPARTLGLVAPLRQLVARNPRVFAGVTVDPLPSEAGDAAVRLRVGLGARIFDLTVTVARDDGPCLFRTDRFAVSHAGATPVDDADDRAWLQRLFAALDAALARRGQDL